MTLKGDCWATVRAGVRQAGAATPGLSYWMQWQVQLCVKREEQALGGGKGMTFAKLSMGRERRGGCVKQDAWARVPEALLCPAEVAVCGRRFRDAEAAQV